MFTFALFSLLLFGGKATATYETLCGSTANQGFATLSDNIDTYAKRLLSLRNEKYGWMNTPSAMTSLAISTPASFANVEASITALENEVMANATTMTLGKLAQVLLAVKATCGNTSNFGGLDLAAEVKKRLGRELISEGNNREPPQGWYGVYLAVGAYCVSERQTPGDYFVLRVLLTQNVHGSFHKTRSVDYTAQAMLALTCIEKVSETQSEIRTRVRQSLHRASHDLLRRVTNDRDDSWIGNRYSTPVALLALMENQKWNTQQQPVCLKILGSLNQQSIQREREGAIAQALPALKGVSVLTLLNVDRQCSFPDTPDVQAVSVPPVVTVSRRRLPTIDVEIIIRPNAYLGGTLQHRNVSQFDVIGITKGTSLHDIMVKAMEQGLMTFQTKSSAWGKYIASINGREANNAEQLYWAIEANHESLPVGIEQYEPSHADQIIFKLKKWS